MRGTRPGVVTILFLATLALAWLVHGTGVVQNDAQRNIYIPGALTMPLQVKAAYNGKTMFFRYRWPTEQPHLYHDLLRYDGSQWQRIGKSPVGPQPKGIYEDRISMLVDDGRVPVFDRFGGFAAIGANMRFFTDQASREDVARHPYLGEKKGKHDVRKFLPATREDPSDWASVVSEDELAALRQAGYFLDFWHWRAHRSNPIGKSDDQMVSEFRYGDAGKGVYFTNWDKENNRPKLMFDPARVGFRALDWDDIAERRLGFDDVYYLSEDAAAPFDPDHQWKEGDTIPRRVLRPGSGSHADIDVAGEGRWREGYWDVTLKRAMDTGHPLDDKAFQDKRIYWAGFAVHRNATGSRWHYVSLPMTVGLGREADIRAARFEGDAPGWEQEWERVTLFYPGQLNWPLLTSHRHAGSEQMAQGVPVGARHTPQQLAHYAVEMEFNDAIIRHWLWTLVAGLLLILGFGIAVIRAMGQAREG